MQIGERSLNHGDLTDGAMTQQGGDERGLLCFLLLVVISLSLAYTFILQNASLVSNWPKFWLLVASLVAFSFLFSAVEAGFSGAPNDRRIATELNTALAEKAQRCAESDQAVAAAGAGLSGSRQERRTRRRAEMQWERLKKKQSYFEGSRRLQIVGALSAINVFLTTALAAFLPSVLLVAPTPMRVASVAVDPGKMLIFVASALPILYLGKIIPKMIGLRNPHFFAYRLYWVARATNWLVGWIPIGLSYALIKARLIRAD